jgi:hypothetical protein
MGIAAVFVVLAALALRMVNPQRREAAAPMATVAEAPGA